MRLIGYWIESLLDTDFYPPQEFIGDLPLETRTKIADYLDTGLVYEVYRGISWCRFFCRVQSMGNKELTDGYWVWPEGLSHYVRDHGVTLPSEFRDHIESRPTPIPKEQWDKSPPDKEFWKDWCRQNASGKYRSKLIAARQRADCEAERIVAKAVAELEATKGVSKVECRWAGCGNKALVGIAFCARCSLKGREYPIVFVSGIYHELRSILTDGQPQ
jgi:hypothetical protein